jgi:hypothetical protein
MEHRTVYDTINDTLHRLNGQPASVDQIHKLITVIQLLCDHIERLEARLESTQTLPKKPLGWTNEEWAQWHNKNISQ